MINRLEIHNIALISHLCLDFDKGLTVLSGETGSGKSIIIDSLAFVLGDRADKSMIKHGSDRASVEVVFTVDSQATYDCMENLGIEQCDTIVVNRTMTLAGKNDCRVNGRNCTTTMLKQLTATLVDIFGQSQHFNLLKVDKHIGVIDGFCNFGDSMSNLKLLYSQYKSVVKQLAQFGGSAGERDRQLDILQFQIDELQSAKLDAQEEQELESQHNRMVNMEKIVSALSTAVDCMSSGDMPVVASIATATNSLIAGSKYDETLAELANRLDSIRIEAVDVADSLSAQLSDCNYNVREVDAIETRLESIRTIKRKYGGSVDSALKFLDNAIAEHETLSNATQLIEQLTAEKQSIILKMYNICDTITDIRRKTAVIFEQNIQNELAELGMKGTTFEVQFEEKPTLEQYSTMVNGNGYDNVEFMLSANIGEPVKPLAKVISGGEMSRFMLAIKNITANIENISTMVFDEIDTGISGNIAQMVAKKLYGVSSQYQCIVITHLPQIVAMGDSNLVITKYEQDGRTISAVNVIDSTADKAEEVARLMGGIGEHSIVNALEMIKWSEQHKLAN